MSAPCPSVMLHQVQPSTTDVNRARPSLSSDSQKRLLISRTCGITT